MASIGACGVAALLAAELASAVALVALLALASADGGDAGGPPVWPPELGDCEQAAKARSAAALTGTNTAMRWVITSSSRVDHERVREDHGPVSFARDKTLIRAQADVRSINEEEAP
jgi:hypothetical protein